MAQCNGRMERIHDTGLLLRAAQDTIDAPRPMRFEPARANFRGRYGRNLAATLRRCERRKEWYRDCLLENGEDPIAFVGGGTVGGSVDGAARSIRIILGRSGRCLRGPVARGNLFDAVADLAESAGILVMVDESISRDVPAHVAAELDIDFHGMTLADDLAPVVFINSALDMQARLRCLVRQLALLWVGISGVSGETFGAEAPCPVARWCDEVAEKAVGLLTDLAHERGLILAHPLETDACMQAVTRASRRFSHAVVAHTKGGKTRFTEAFRLLDIPDSDMFLAIDRSFEKGI